MIVNEKIPLDLTRLMKTTNVFKTLMARVWGHMYDRNGHIMSDSTKKGGYHNDYT